ncbi:MAG: hypothetical protein JWP75_3362, partial [Frondihabitans sp.]|nr:hypothetical protein [Frondihabitans sp.]
KALAPYLDVKGVPSSITKLAKKVTVKAANPFDAAVEIQDYFRDGDFTYSEQTPVAEGYDGSGLDEVETFLKRKSGYCVHFASAMAVMARTLGIPSRIAVGFLPGQEVGSTDEWTVTSNDLHTWPELYFQGLGWVPFEPTVGQGTTSSYLQQTQATASPSATSSPSTSATVAPTATSSAVATPTATATSGVSSASSEATATTGGTGIDSSAFVAFGIALLIILGLFPWYLRSARRRRRLGVGPPDAALEAWREVVDTARDLGAPVDPGATPQATAGLLRGALDPVGAAALARLLGRVQAERFGGQPADSDVHGEARTVIAALRASAPRSVRLWATLAPRSLFAEPRQRTTD